MYQIAWDVKYCENFCADNKNNIYVLYLNNKFMLRMEILLEV